VIPFGTDVDVLDDTLDLERVTVILKEKFLLADFPVLG
jgi:hypothetical protein